MGLLLPKVIFKFQMPNQLTKLPNENFQHFIKKILSAKEALATLTVISIFIGVSIFAKQYGDLLQEISYFEGYIGVLLYIAITIIAVVVAPISTIPLLPLAVSLWGSFFAAVLSIIGWTIGAVIAFWIARNFGKPLIGKIVSLEKIQRIENIIPKSNIFVSILLLRMTLPVDVLSYALGLFSSVSFRLYFIATIIGVTPFAFFFSYAVLFPVEFQLLFVLLTMIILAVGYRR